MIPLIENIYAGKGLYQELLSPLCRKYELTESELVILLYLADRNPADTATKIIHSQRLKKSVVSVSIDGLLKKGLISSFYHEDDHRTKHLTVNETAKPIIREGKKIQDQYYELMTEGLKDEEKDSLNRILRKVNRNIGRYGI